MVAILKKLGGKEANAVSLCSNLAFDVYACREPYVLAVPPGI